MIKYFLIGLLASICIYIPLLKTAVDEFWYLDDEKHSVDSVDDVPDNFKEWIADNADRIGKAESGQGTLPYFIRDNKEVVDAILRGESTETTVSNSGKAVSNPENGSIATEKAVSEMETKERERIEANRREYERLLADPEYTDVEFNPKNGGLKAKHKNHNIDKDKGWYELEVQETAYQHGHSVILEEEIHTIQGKKNVEGLFDGLPFEIAGAETGIPNNIRNALKHCASKPSCKVAVVFYPDESKIIMTAIREGLKKYFGLRNNPK